jgi:prophage antirepressor-like protein
MIEEIKEDNNCIIKAFENNPISIITENIDDKKIYCFKASDIGKVLNIVNIRTSIMNYDEDEKVVRTTYSSKSGNPDTIYLTSQGVYRLLYNSKKENAKKFRKWAGNILDDIIFNESKELKHQLEKQKELLAQKTLENIKDKETILLKSYDKKSVVYLILINGILYKFGYSNDIKERFKTHKKEIGENITLIYCIESKNNILLEQNLKDYLQNTNYRKTQSFNDKNQTELIEINDITIIQNKLERLNKIIHENKETLEYKMKILELENENIKLKIKQLVFLQEYTNEEKNKEEEIIEEEIKIELQQESKQEIEEIKIELQQENTQEDVDETKKINKKKEYYEKNKTRLLQQKKEYYEENKDKNRELKNQRNREYRKNNKDLIKQKDKEYRDKNKDIINKKRRESRNKELESKRSKEYYEKNKELVLQKHRLYYDKNKEQLNEKKRTEYKNTIVIN